MAAYRNGCQGKELSFSQHNPSEGFKNDYQPFFPGFSLSLEDIYFGVVIFLDT